MIISGYQGIGKSTIAGKENCIDLESGNFWVDSRRPRNWYKIYANIANNLSKQGYTVFVSCHEEVRKELENLDEQVVVICPSLWLKDEWIDRLKERYLSSNNIKDKAKNMRALANSEESYDDSIKSIIEGKLAVYIITSMDYNLSKIINNLNKGVNVDEM